MAVLGVLRLLGLYSRLCGLLMVLYWGFRANGALLGFWAFLQGCTRGSGSAYGAMLGDSGARGAVLGL